MMLLTIDVGNTNTVLGVFRGKELAANWRLTTARDQTVDEYGILTRDLFTIAKLDPHEIRGVIISSVVPPLNSTLAGMAERYFHTKALFVEPGIRTGMPVHYDNPQEVGADRIVNSIAAYAKYGGPCIVVDFGTAINFDVVSERGEYLGGALAPGIGISAISGRGARAGDWHFGRGAFFTRGAALARGDSRSRKNYRHEYGALHAGGPFLWLHRPGGRNSGAHQERARQRHARDRHRRAGVLDRAGVTAYPAGGRISHPGRAAHHLGTKSTFTSCCAGGR